MLATALGQGMVIAPVLDGYCVLGLERDELAAVLGSAHRLALDSQSLDRLVGSVPRREQVVRLLYRRAVVVCQSGIAGGVALGAESLLTGLGQVLREDLWVGVPDEPEEPAELAEALGDRVALVVAGEGPVGPGPTVVDMTRLRPEVDRRGAVPILEVEKELGGIVRIRKGIIFSVLVVCTGNSCRSPLAAAILSQLMQGLPVLVSSAGTAAPAGAPVCSLTLETAARFGLVDLSTRARQVTSEMCRSSDLILVMERHHRDELVRLEPAAAGRIRMLLGYPDECGEEVPDPIGKPREFYEMVAAMMRPALERIAGDIRARLVY